MILVSDTFLLESEFLLLQNKIHPFSRQGIITHTQRSSCLRQVIVNCDTILLGWVEV
jgi:hypothetical protein